MDKPCRSCGFSYPEVRFRTTKMGNRALSCIPCETNKPCKVCGRRSPEVVFRFRSDRDGRREEKCRDCVSNNTKKWLRDTKSNDPDKYERWYKNHIIITSKRQKMWLKTEQGRVWRREYGHKNREKLNKVSREWCKNHPEAIREKGRKKYIKKKGIQGSHTEKEWIELKITYDYTCLKCGKKEPEITLTRDHVIPITKGGSDFIINIQPLCRSCNSGKHTATIDYRVKKEKNCV